MAPATPPGASADSPPWCSMMADAPGDRGSRHKEDQRPSPVSWRQASVVAFHWAGPFGFLSSLRIRGPGTGVASGAEQGLGDRGQPLRGMVVIDDPFTERLQRTTDLIAP